MVVPTWQTEAGPIVSRRTGSSDGKVLIRSPLSGSHRQTFILLHGRGSSASEFGPEFLETPVPDFGSLADAFPDARFVFPTASRRRARNFNRALIRQWFDHGSLDVPEKSEEHQNDGLRETSHAVHELLRKEVELVGARNVVLGGLSQGCAASLVALLLWEGEALAAGFGMCGWLPYRKRMEERMREKCAGVVSDEDEDEDDIFDRSFGDQDEQNPDAQGAGRASQSGDVDDPPAPAEAMTDISPVMEAVCFLRQETEFHNGSAAAPLPLGSVFQQIPLFLGHGTNDDRVSVQLGRLAACCLKAMNVDVHWEEYLDLDHWYSGPMLRDMIVFLRAHAGWEVHDEDTDRVMCPRRGDRVII